MPLACDHFKAVRRPLLTGGLGGFALLARINTGREKLARRVAFFPCVGKSSIWIRAERQALLFAPESIL